MRPIDEHLDLVDIIDAAEHDWDDYLDKCYETETAPVEAFEDFIADAVLSAGYHKVKDKDKEDSTDD